MVSFWWRLVHLKNKNGYRVTIIEDFIRSILMGFTNFLIHQSTEEKKPYRDQKTEKIFSGDNRVQKINTQIWEPKIDLVSERRWITQRDATWKFTDVRKHAFILGDQYQSDWAHAAMYMCSYLSRINLEAKVVMPTHWKRTKLPEYFNPEYITSLPHITDLIDQGYGVWFWGWRGKTHWLPKDITRELVTNPVRVHVVEKQDKNQWVSDRVIRLQKGGVQEFVFSFCGRGGDDKYL